MSGSRPRQIADDASIIAGKVGRIGRGATDTCGQVIVMDGWR